MDPGRCCGAVVMGIGLVTLCLSPCAASARGGEDLHSLAHSLSGHQAWNLLTLLRSLTADFGLKASPHTERTVDHADRRAVTKRGFGIAGLDNVDMITSVLDRSRSRSRHRPHMSASVDLKHLRALMAKAG